MSTAKHLMTCFFFIFTSSIFSFQTNHSTIAGWMLLLGVGGMVLTSSIASEENEQVPIEETEVESAPARGGWIEHDPPQAL